MRQITKLKTVREVGKGLESELAVSTSIIYLTVALEIIACSLPYCYFHFILFSLCTVMYPAYAKWIKSHRDLPLKLNQWNNVVVCRRSCL